MRGWELRSTRSRRWWGSPPSRSCRYGCMRAGSGSWSPSGPCPHCCCWCCRGSAGPITPCWSRRPARWWSSASRAGGLAEALVFYLPLYALTFTFVGLDPAAGQLARTGPVALLFGSTELLTGSHGTLAIPLLIMIGVSTLIGELIANYVRLQVVAGETLDELLMSVSGLTGCTTVDGGRRPRLRCPRPAGRGGRRGAAAAGEPGSTRYLYAGGSGSSGGQRRSRARCAGSRHGDDARAAPASPRSSGG